MRTVGTLNAPPKSPSIFPTKAPSFSLSIVMAAFSLQDDQHFRFTSRVDVGLVRPTDRFEALKRTARSNHLALLPIVAKLGLIPYQDRTCCCPLTASST